MIDKQLLQLLDECVVLARRCLVAQNGGETISRRKGFGVEFYQLRDYVAGDDVRYIDWKSTGRMGKMMMRECIELQKKRITVVLDCSASMGFGSTRSKFAQGALVAAIIATVAMTQGDEVTILLVHERVETLHVTKEIPLHLLLDKLLAVPCRGIFSPAAAQRHIAMMPQANIVIIISDFLAMDYSALFGVIAGRSEAYALQLVEPLEQSFPYHVQIQTKDSEEGTLLNLSPSNAALIPRIFAQHTQQLQQTARRYGVMAVTINTTDCTALALVGKLHPLLQFG